MDGSAGTLVMLGTSATTVPEPNPPPEPGGGASGSDVTEPDGTASTGGGSLACTGAGAGLAAATRGAAPPKRSEAQPTMLPPNARRRAIRPIRPIML